MARREVDPLSAREAECGSLFQEFDHRDPESHEDPLPRWRDMRELRPCAYSNAYGGIFVLSRYADVIAALGDPKPFSSALTQTQIPTLPSPPFPPSHYDPPDNRPFRLILNP